MTYRIIFSFIISFINLSFYTQELKYYSCIAERIDVNIMETQNKIDDDGVICSSRGYHPLLIVQFGVLSYYEFLKTKDSTHYFKCINQIKYFKDSSKINLIFDGKGVGLPYNFNYGGLKAPWYSGMTQGYALSYLLRYRKLTGDDSVNSLIEKIAYVLLQKQEDGGTISTTKEGYTWIEEYPNSKKSQQVLNGYINGLIGLKEYYDFFPKDTLAERILSETLIGVTNSLELYDTKNWTYYNRNRGPVSNKYLRYQIYEMKHLYEIFGDEIFDHQMRLWSVMSLNKNVSKKFKVAKYPNHKISVPHVKIETNLFGMKLNQKHLVANDDSLEKSYLYKLKKVKKYAKTRKWKSNQKKSENKYLIFKSQNDEPTDYIEFKNLSNIDMKMYEISKGKLNKLPHKQHNYKNKTSITFPSQKIEDLIIKLNGLNDTTLSILNFNLYNSKAIKPPFFIHHKYAKNYQFKKGETYAIQQQRFNTSKAVVFYKSASSPAKLKNVKWKAKNYVSEEFTATKTGIYKFMIVYDYQSPLSMVSNLIIKPKN